MEEKIKTYRNNEITVTWKPELCTHSTLCWKGLPRVFNPRNRPWIALDHSNTESITAQIDKCPSGALSYTRNQEQAEEIKPSLTRGVIEIAKDGPILVQGEFLLRHGGDQTGEVKKAVALCRCGSSSKKPFCDGTHRKINFKD